VSTERPYYPALLKVPAADELYDSGDFSLAAICEHIAYDRVCVSAKYSDNRFFMYNDQSGASHLLKDETENADHFINLTMDELKDVLADPTFFKGYVYFHSTLSEVAPTFARSCEAWRGLSLRNPTQHEGVGAVVGAAGVGGGGGGEAEASADLNRELNLWIGSAGCVTQAHYDTEDNIFVQLHGSKRFKFYSPTKSTQLHLFPDAHPRARKSQVDFDAAPGSSEKFPNYAKDLAPDLELVLGPGDCLWIPAFWIHHVETLEASVSANVFSESAVWTIAEEILSNGNTPFSRMKGEAAAEVMFAFTDHLFPSIGCAHPRQFAGCVCRARYDPLEGGSNRAAGDKGAVGTHDNGEAFRGHAEPFIAAFRRMASVEGGEDVQDLVLAHLLELWAVRVAGPDGVGPLLRRYASGTASDSTCA
jgi:hypothetical protein